MKTVVSTALCVFVLGTFLQVNSNAEGEDAIAEVAQATPQQPASWNVVGEAEIEGLQWAAQPVACPDGAEGNFCVELTVHNPTFDAQTVATNVTLMGMNQGSPMARMPEMPYQIQSQAVDLQALGGQRVVSLVAFTLPEETPFSLQVQVGGSDPWSGTILANYVNPTMADWTLTLNAELPQEAITF